MYLGDYLINEKIITSDQLVTALCYQLESMPSFFRLIFEQKLVGSNTLLSLIKKHIKDDDDILNVLIKEKILNQDQVNELAQLQVSKKIPLGEALVHLNIITSEVLKTNLDKYFLVKNEKSKVESSNSHSDQNVNDAALESLKELGIDLSEFGLKDSSSVEKPEIYPSREEVKHFLEIFNEKQKNKMIKLIEICIEAEGKSQDVANYFNSIFRDFHLLKGAASFAEIAVLEKGLSELDKKLDFVLSSGESSIKAFINKNASILIQVTTILWDLRQTIESLQTDFNLDKKESCLEFLDLISDLKIG